VPFPSLAVKDPNERLQVALGGGKLDQVPPNSQFGQRVFDFSLDEKSLSIGHLNNRSKTCLVSGPSLSLGRLCSAELNGRVFRHELGALPSGGCVRPGQ
jgi:hypothetical protein